MKHKKGIIGELIPMFFATIAIVIILLIFVFGAKVVKTIEGNTGETVVSNETAMGIRNIFTYAEEYTKLIELRLIILEGNKLPLENKTFLEEIKIEP